MKSFRMKLIRRPPASKYPLQTDFFTPLFAPLSLSDGGGGVRDIHNVLSVQHSVVVKKISEKFDKFSDLNLKPSFILG